MANLFNAVFLVLLSTATASEVNPVGKVITLIEGLKKEVEDEGKTEAGSYDKFACFCKDTTTTKSDSVKKLHESINLGSADIAEKTQERKDDQTELGERKVNQEKLSKDLDDTIARCKKEEAAYDAEAADLNKAISSLKSAIKAMKDTGGSAASLLAIQSVVTELSASRASSGAQQTLLSLMQQRVDPENPEYGYHSQDIIDLCAQLLTDFKKSKQDLDTEWGKTDKACKATKKSLKKEMKSNADAMEKLGNKIERLAKEIAGHREDLIEDQGALKDDELYLKDLTARCEDRANDYDQRSAMRADELKALTEALDVLTKRVKSADDDANERAAFLQKAMPVASAKPSEVNSKTLKAFSFLQNALAKEHGKTFLERTDGSLELETKKNNALAFLRSEGRRIESVTIASLTARVAADPFKKVKGLIQKLIERLLEESRAEATKKGFCDEALGSAEHERNARFEQANDLSREIKSLEAKEDELSEEIDELTKAIKEESDTLKKTTEDREEEKSENMDTLKVAKEGLAAVTEALLILKSFYSQAAKASAALVQASPVDEDTSGPGFSGNYKGKQGGMKAVFALLEVIQSDFDRTLRKTDEAEQKAHRDYVEFSQTSKSSIAGKETKKELDEQDLQTTKTTLKKKMSDLQDTVDLLDKALEELEELKPTCIDTGMSYEERVKKREEEIAALEKALQILAP